MPDKAAIIDTFYDAWNRHDVAAIVDPFAADGLYADPLTRIGVHGDSLTAHVEPFVVRDGRLIIGQHRYAGRKAEAVIEALGVQTTDSKERNHEHRQQDACYRHRLGAPPSTVAPDGMRRRDPR